MVLNCSQKCHIQSRFTLNEMTIKSFFAKRVQTFVAQKCKILNKQKEAARHDTFFMQIHILKGKDAKGQKRESEIAK